MSTKKIRIITQSYDHRVLDSAVKKILVVARQESSKVVGPILIPTKKEKITILRSVHRHKDSREQLEIRTHKRLIDIYEPSSELLKKLKLLHLPHEIDVELKL